VPVSRHARARAAARAAAIAASTAGASWARRVMVRDTVGSEATNPYTAGSARTRAMSARQSPPSASVTARSAITLPGSWIAKGSRQRASVFDSSRSSPTAWIVSVSTSPPACDTTIDPPASALGHG
jgi:hypothetical protein